VLRTLVKDNTNAILQSNIINRFDCPSDVLNYLSIRTSYELRARIALHANATTTLLMSLAKDGSIRVRAALARRNPLPSAVAIRLLDSNTKDIIRRVLDNQSVDAGVLVLFSLAT